MNPIVLSSALRLLAASAGFAAVALLGLVPPPSQAGEERPIRGEVVARLSITVRPDETGTLVVPSPFAVLPGGMQVAIYVPESKGIFLLEGTRILHHFPLPPGASSIQDLDATDRWVIAGRRPGSGQETCHLEIFDLKSGAAFDPVSSANPFLRCTGDGADHWRIVAEGNRVGVYHPGTGASVPLWEVDRGLLPSPAQMEGQRAGIGLRDGPAWVPNPDGSVSRAHRGRTRDVTEAADGFFLDGWPNEDLLLLEPADVADLPGERGVLLPPVLRVRHWQGETIITELRLKSVSPRVGAERLVAQGRPVRAQGRRIYWMYVGYDFLEIRSMELPTGPVEGRPPPAAPPPDSPDAPRPEARRP